MSWISCRVLRLLYRRCSDHAPFNLTFRELSVASELDLRNLNGYGQEILSWRFSSRFDTLLPCRIVKYICYRAQFAIQRWNVENGKGKISITVFRGPKISSTLVAWKGFKREILYVERSLYVERNGWNEAWQTFSPNEFHRIFFNEFLCLRAFFRIPTVFASMIREKIRMFLYIHFITRGEFLFPIFLFKLKK